MVEFKINPVLTDEISGVRDVADKINDGYASVSTDGVSTLKTSIRIISQHEKIKSLLDLYKVLVLRDLQDLDEMVAEVNEMDAKISSSQQGGGGFR